MLFPYLRDGASDAAELQEGSFISIENVVECRALYLKILWIGIGREWLSSRGLLLFLPAWTVPSP